MTDHQKAVCWDTLKDQLEIATIPITGTVLLTAMNDMEKAMAHASSNSMMGLLREILAKLLSKWLAL